MSRCTCAGLSTVPKHWWTDFWTKTCPVCNGNGQARVPQEVQMLKQEATSPAKGGDIVAGVEFMLAALREK